MILFYKAFGFETFGVDYSLPGCDITRQILYTYGLDTTNVFMYDFTSNRFQERFKEQFDVVFSAGLLEHFQDSSKVIDKHVNLLKPGGCLIITIPNLSGINGKISDFLNPEITKICNNEIMDVPKYLTLFDKPELNKLYCGYIGVFSFGIFNTAKNSKKQIFMHIGGLLQTLVLDRIFSKCFMNKSIEGGISPCLIYIGKKVI